MNNVELFSAVIDFYKSCQSNLAIDGGFIKLSESLSLTQEQAVVLKSIYENKHKFKSFKLTIDYDDVEDPTVIVANAQCSELKIELSPYSHCKFSFYKNENDMLRRLSSTLLQGNPLPDHYYLSDIEFRNDSDFATKSILNLQAATKWLSFLRNISDIQKETQNGICLYFLIKSGNDKFAQPLEVNFSNIEKICDTPKISVVDDIEMLISDTELGNLHSKDKQAFFKLALVDVIKSSKEKNTKSVEGIFLFKNLDQIKICYYEHYEVFIHNFAIGEFQQQVQDKWFEFSEKINLVLSDIKSKLYAVPIALVSLGTLSALTDVYSYIFICTGVFVTGIINHWMVNDQEERLKQIEESSDQTFEKIKKSKSANSEPTEIFNTVINTVSNISERISSARSKIKIYKSLCWLPTFIMLTLFFLKERKVIQDFFYIDTSKIYYILIEQFIKFLAKLLKLYFL